MKALGLMSGTSCDGVDAVLLEIDSPDVRHAPTVLGHAHVSFPAELQAELREPTKLVVPRLSELHFVLPRIYAEAARAIEGWNEAECCGMHGQTVWNAPPSRKPKVASTLQIGSSGALAALIDLPVVGDLRSADIARGGEGAPIIAFAHWFFTATGSAPRLVVNLGGIAGFTYVTDALEHVAGSELGPGMMVTDALARHVSEGQLAYDHDGHLSMGGAVEPQVVEMVLSHPFFERPPPRSTGREDFGSEFVRELLCQFGHLPGPTLLTSSLFATARAVARAATRDLPGVDEVVLTGGGALHPRLVEMVAELVHPIPVTVPSAGVMAPRNSEPAAMALIATRTLHHLPSSLPAVTGANEPAVLGHVYWPR